ncbi:hypothetical protein GUITHDRAFT_153807 [Guillardia theta CCMP2712]|uniref:Uncharacterized protein n=1 Tax=Guillardia theta (strain CCMP2712) TaxID=905079 RepID=L1J045_GUITC|nr:hypothetical protein GUITHDRAFT_153807 [Guillardia theta CCMP2712]EKX41455.1 hypothetical protein GUITHDRAFT_153807 [Guillardia theta CCMP2712]|eukprot:XP_005828435.1 hypothetical protein GUITHDRAFT_153807 [Guillardia theta CCMP2712]
MVRLVGLMACLVHLAAGFVMPGRLGFCSSRRSVQGKCLQIRMGRWDSPTWRWGYSQGDAHDLAFQLRTKLFDENSRMDWLRNLVNGQSVEWEDVKVVLGLLWQRANREAWQGSDYYNDILNRMVAAHYEGSQESDKVLMADMEEGLHRISAYQDMDVLMEILGQADGDFTSHDFDRRLVALRVFMGFDFVKSGI